MKPVVRSFFAAVLLAGPALGQQPAKPVVYNEEAGDGNMELDREIKAAYAARFTILDTKHSEGYVEPIAMAGSLPSSAVADGQPLMGYVRVAYIVTAYGLVADPVILRSTDKRLDKVATEAMKEWRFTPGKLGGVAVATTAAQEFNFGPVDVLSGFAMDRLITYQNSDVLLARLPGPQEFGPYVDQLKSVVHNFFVGAAGHETLQVVVVLQPGRRSRVWFVSSARPGDAKELQALRRLLEGVPPVDVHGGPVAFALSGTIAGGDGKGAEKAKGARRPVPAEWLDAAKSLDPPVPVSSDEYLNLVLREAK